jgi:hypothetical protein
LMMGRRISLWRKMSAKRSYCRSLKRPRRSTSVNRTPGSVSVILLQTW